MWVYDMIYRRENMVIITVARKMKMSTSTRFPKQKKEWSTKKKFGTAPFLWAATCCHRHSLLIGNNWKKTLAL